MKNIKVLPLAALILALVLSLFAACSGTVNSPSDISSENIPLDPGTTESAFKAAEASGIKTETSQTVILDYSNNADGYIMLKYSGTNQKVKTQLTGVSGVTYTYDQSLTGSWDVYPLTDGNGSYKISVFENISGNSYATIFSFRLTVSLKDEFAPFLISNKYVNYSNSSKVVTKAAELCAGKTTVLRKIKAVYEYVIGNFTYDYTLAKTVQSGYIPDLEADMDKKSGICFDYAAVMTAMLRSQGIPTKMVFGYTGSVYHAWISVYSPEKGWMNSVIYFNGKEWKLMDPTFASTGKSSAAIIKYIGNGKNYTAKYLY
ncbi:MAG: transglutaminase-like domain-containing protein [Oscillospiraceae bacterium]